MDAEVEAIARRSRRSREERARIGGRPRGHPQLSEQAQREIEGASKAARAELRAYAAEQSVRLAEELIRREIRPEDDARLMNGYVEELGGIRR